MKKLSLETKEKIEEWCKNYPNYLGEKFIYKVRDKENCVELKTESLSKLQFRISLPKYSDWGDLLKWLYDENLPGYFPFTAVVFPFKRQEEDPARQFAGEGCPERTNKRFHYLSTGISAKRLARIAFDAITLYGWIPNRPISMVRLEIQAFRLQL